MTIERRHFVRLAAGAAGAALAGFGALAARNRLGSSRATRVARLGEGGYGPLVSAGPELALPKDFEYRRISVAGSPMSDGRLVPGAHDGMAAFSTPEGLIRLIRNHEIELTSQGPIAEPAYDRFGGGGTTTVDFDPIAKNVVREFVSLAGTVRNCAGGPTPWGSWLSCEESVVGPRHGTERPHGFVFEVPLDADGPVEPLPLEALGRFVHEAAAVDPATGVVYLTEDQTRAGFYRFLPAVPYRPGQRADLRAGGRLQMLAVRDHPRYDCSRNQTVDRDLPVGWVDIENPNPDEDGLRASAVFDQGWRSGGARFTRIEGCWFGNGSVFLSCTDGGNARRGQIWGFDPGEGDGVLTLLFESPGPEVLDAPDNVCVSPRGGVLICEDGPGTQFVRGLTPDGRIFDFAHNLANDSEFAGPTFSPDGSILFLNVQRGPGASYAIWGPWDTGSL